LAIYLLGTVLQTLDPQEYSITRGSLAVMSPYLTDHYLRFGNFVIDLDTLPPMPEQGHIPVVADDD
jgi:hypothetical protein